MKYSLVAVTRADVLNLVTLSKLGPPLRYFPELIAAKESGMRSMLSKKSGVDYLVTSDPLARRDLGLWA